MKKIFAMLALALTFAAVAGSQQPKKDAPMPKCYPCT